LLLAARDAVAEDGPGVGVRAIADRAGLGVTTLYRHFPSKDALVDAVSVHRWATMEWLARGGSRAPDPLHAVVVTLETFTRMVTVDERFIASAGLRVGRTPDAILPVKARFEPTFEELWTEAQRRNLIRRRSDPRDAVEIAGLIRDDERRIPMLLMLVNGICTDAVDGGRVLADVLPHPVVRLR
jgi:AcrR family transcriptional regulator